MLVFVSAYPSSKNEKDGMIRRIKSIDEVFQDKNRIYLELSWRKYIFLSKSECVSDKVTVYRANAFIYIPFLLYLMKKAQIIYVHSVMNAMKIIYAYLFWGKIITDMHGVGSEELRLLGRPLWKIKICSLSEYITVRNSYRIIVVTHNMGTFYQNTYGIKKERIIFISIFNRKTVQNNYNRLYSAIYCGGIHKWQCIDELKLLIKKTIHKYHWTVLTGTPKEFSSLENIELKTVSNSEVYNYYKKNTFGIVLRDNDIVNRVACPTKLIEYIQCGLLPVVKSPYIGDFFELGYNYITEEAFASGNIPRLEDIQTMTKNNLVILNKIYAETDAGLLTLKRIIG